MSNATNPYMGLRARAFDVTRANLAESEAGKPWGVIMETGYPEGTATIVAFADGNASLYFSSGGGAIGGRAHAVVRQAAKACVAIAAGFTSKLQPTPDRSLPREGETAFYLLSDDGVLGIRALEDDLGGQRHPLSPLFFAAHDVVTAYRQTS